MGVSSDYKQSFMMNQTANDEDFLNNEWERILKEVENQCLEEQKAGNKTKHEPKEIVYAARQKYMRKLVSESNVFSLKGLNSETAKNKNKTQGAVSNLIEYYNGENIGVDGKDQEQYEPDDEGSTATINDVIFSLLLIHKDNIHMHINSDYEIKK